MGVRESFLTCLAWIGFAHQTFFTECILFKKVHKWLKIEDTPVPLQVGVSNPLQAVIMLLLAFQPTSGLHDLGTPAHRLATRSRSVGLKVYMDRHRPSWLFLRLNATRPEHGYPTLSMLTRRAEVKMQVDQVLQKVVETEAGSPPDVWRAEAEAHRERMLSILHGKVNHDLRHPIWNFLFVYFQFQRKLLLQWSPGLDRHLTGVSPEEEILWTKRGWTPAADGSSGRMDARLCKKGARKMLRLSAEVMRSAAIRPPHLSCFGLHEWAMLYAPSPTSNVSCHQDLPLRLSQAEINAVVEGTKIACTHFDAFRFFAPGAVPMNTVKPTPARELTPLLEQPGCVHSSMDLFKYCVWLWPYVRAEVLADALELAIAARVLDMRASPYDLSEFDGDGFDLTPIRIETAAGRQEYQQEQARLAAQAAPIRWRVLQEYEAAIAVWDAQEEEKH
mmetsp:Transcript_64392/g.112218  ORF Transcript_64392/g.112218 Transcript_64392/m.112218 type:complete len:446 (+) Transcript_64392:52-1389(+)